MNTEFSDDEMVELLRRSAQVLPGTRAEHVAAAGTAGRTMRRRRRAASVIGAGTAGLVVIAGVTALGLNAGNSTESVVQSVAPAGDPKPQSGSPENEAAAREKAALAALTPEQRAAMSAEDAARNANVALLLDTLGPDFRLRNPDESGLAVTVRDGSAAAAALPEGWNGGANIALSEDGSFLSERCEPGQEKGSAKEACTSVTLTNGRSVYVQPHSFGLGSDSPSTAEGVWYYYGRPDGSVVHVMIEASTLGGAGQSTRNQAVAWLGRYTEALTGLAADERVEPEPTTTGQTPKAPVTTSHDRDLVVMQRALGINFTVLDGKVSLEPNWPLYKELPTLPHGYWEVIGDITSITRSAFDAACTAKAGAAACETRTVDGNEVHVRTWADKDAQGEFVGESVAYFVRPDGQVVLANLELRSVQLEPSATARVAGAQEWLQALEPSLIKAATDPAVEG